MWADDQEPFGPPKRSWSPWWTAVAVLLGVWVGFLLAGGSVASLLGNHLWQGKTTSHQASARSQDERSRSAVRVAAPIAPPRETAAPAQPSVPSAHPAADRPLTTRQLFLCKDYAGGMFWSSAACSTQRATIDRIATVPGQLPAAADPVIDTPMGRLRRVGVVEQMAVVIGVAEHAHRPTVDRLGHLLSLADGLQ